MIPTAPPYGPDANSVPTPDVRDARVSRADAIAQQLGLAPLRRCAICGIVATRQRARGRPRCVGCRQRAARERDAR